MYILGLSCYYHDSAAAILKNGKLITAVEEERFSRKKFDDGFPKQAINFCLKTANIKPEDIDIIAFYDKNLIKFERLLDNYIAVAPKGLKNFLNVIPKWIHKRLWIKEEIKKEIKGFQGEIVFPGHHISHASYAFFTSPFDESAILTVDGVGEWTTTSFGYAENNSITITNDIRWPHSIGLIYSAFTYFLGFEVNEGEYKLMGLSSYGKPKYYDLILKELIDVKNDGSFQLNMKYFSFTYDNVMTNNKFEELFGIKRRTEKDKINNIHYDIGASIQLVLEEILLKIVKHIHQKTKQKNLCYAGGVALNGVANYRLLKESPFENIYIPPSPGDAGSAIGCAQYAFYNKTKSKKITESKNNIKNYTFTGPEYSNKEIERFLVKNDIKYKKLERQELLKKTAEMIAKDSVIGWFQGKMEWGPRALGNRSILANPTNEKMKDILNEKIKHRENFRPFAPSILEEYASEFFDIDIPSPHMLFVANVKKPQEIPAVTHVDNTARVQTVARESNPLYYDLINEFFKIKKVPVLINTSMNVRGQPIVNTPKQAFELYKNTEMEYLVINNFVI